MKSRHLSRNAKLRIYRAVIRSTAIYAYETFVMNKAQEEPLEIWERKTQNYDVCDSSETKMVVSYRKNPKGTNS